MSLSKYDRWADLGRKRSKPYHEAPMLMSEWKSWSELGLSRRKAWNEEIQKRQAELQKLQAKLQEARTSSVLKLQTPDRIELLKITIALGVYNDRIGQDSPVYALSEDILRMIVNNILPRKYIEEDGVTKAGVILALRDIWPLQFDIYSPRTLSNFTCNEKILSFIESNRDKILKASKDSRRLNTNTPIVVEFRNILQQLGIPVRDYDDYNYQCLRFLTVSYVQIRRPYVLDTSNWWQYHNADMKETHICQNFSYIDEIPFHKASETEAPKFYTGNGREVGVIVGSFWSTCSSIFDISFFKNKKDIETVIFHEKLVETVLKKQEFERQSRLSEEIQNVTNEINTILQQLGIRTKQLVHISTVEELKVVFVPEDKYFFIDISAYDTFQYEDIIYFDSLKQNILQEF